MISHFILDRIIKGTPFECSMELNLYFNCHLSSKFSETGYCDQKILDFFNENHFLIAWNMFDHNWSNEIQAEEIFKKLILIYNFNPNDENLLIIRGPKVIYLSDHQFIKIPNRGVFVYDKTKVEVDCQEINNVDE